MQKRVKLIAIGLICIALGSVVLASLHSIPVSRVFAVQATMVESPENDAALHDWLIDQPGLIKSSIHIQRSHVGTVTVTFMMSQNGWNYPPFPRLEQKCVELGYKLESGQFVNCDR